MANRPSTHKQLMFLPTIVGTALFNLALGFGGLMDFLGFFALLFVTAIPFQYSYGSLFPIEPHHLAEAKLIPSALLFSGQALFWVGFIAVVGQVVAKHGT